MSHTRPTPEEKRPTYEEMHWKVAAARNTKERPQLTAEVTGLWVSGAEFKIQITGDRDDVLETIESLDLNGNLEDVDCEIKDR